MLAFGFYSGLPLSLTIFTLQQWFTVSGVSIHAVSFTASLGLPYTLKFLWSPLFDRQVGRMGRRRFWLVVIQPCLIAATVALALSNPGVAPAVTAAAAFAVALSSASQDIVIDAWRIETFPQAEQGAALAAYVWGYRTAMLASGAGAMGLASVAGWHVALLTIAALMALSPLLTLTAPEPPASAVAPQQRSFGAAIDAAFMAPLMDLLRRPGALSILAVIILFRLGKVFADNTAASFYHAMGFSTGLVARANFLPNLTGVFLGAAFGAWLVARMGMFRATLLAGAIQALSLSLYIALFTIGGPVMLFAKVGGEYFGNAAADTAFLTLVSALCAREFTATQYAVLSSLAAIPLHSLASGAGYLAEAMGWGWFYAATIAAGFPALLILLTLRGRLPDGR
jgi:PAT family beta-lactamase induction signal transducer AmpG